jgi:uncharacterized protein DUF4430
MRKLMRQNCFGKRWLGLVLVGLALAAAATTAPCAEPEANVQLVVDYGDGVQLRFGALPWRDGMTVFDALSAAAAHRHGVTFEHKGSGASAMITKIGDLKNEGNGRNWLYSVNDKQAEISAGIYKLKPRDAVLWKFDLYR